MQISRPVIAVVLTLALQPALLAHDPAAASAKKPVIAAITHVKQVCSGSPHITATVAMKRLADIPYTLVAFPANGSGSPSYSQSFTPTKHRETMSVYFSSNGKYPSHVRRTGRAAKQSYDVRLLWSGHEGQQTSAAKKFSLPAC